MGVSYHRDAGQSAADAWYRSLWVVLLVAFLVALLAAWVTVARHAEGEAREGLPAQTPSPTLALTRSG